MLPKKLYVVALRATEVLWSDSINGKLYARVYASESAAWYAAKQEFGLEKTWKVVEYARS